MAYNETLSTRIEEILSEYPGFSKKKMFGGMCFMLNRHMCCGVVDDKLMVRVGPEAYDEALEEPEAVPMDFTGRPMKGMLFILPPAIDRDEVLEKWVMQAMEFVHSLPPKK